MMDQYDRRYYVVSRCDPMSGPDPVYLILDRDSTGHERYTFTHDIDGASQLDERTAYEKLHSCELHHEGKYQVNEVTVTYKVRTL